MTDENMRWALTAQEGHKRLDEGCNIRFVIVRALLLNLNKASARPTEEDIGNCTDSILGRQSAQHGNTLLFHKQCQNVYMLIGLLYFVSTGLI